MNKQQIIQKLSFIATSSENVDAVRSSLFRFMAELTLEGVTEEKTYNTRLFPNDVRREIIVRDQFTCTYCNRRGGVDIDPDGELWTIDHVIPASKGGITCAGNGVLACWRCNSEKRDMLPAEYIRWLRFQKPTTVDECESEYTEKVIVRSLVEMDTSMDLPREIVSVYVSGQKWDNVGQQFFEVYPDGTQSDLCRAMVQLTNDGRNPFAFKGEAHRLYHLYSQYGKNYKGGN